MARCRIWRPCARRARAAARIRIVIRKLNEVLSNRGGTAPNKSPQQDYTCRYYQAASCRYPFDQLVIRPDGKVSLCGNDAYGQVTLGDTTRQSLAGIWYGEDYAGCAPSWARTAAGTCPSAAPAMCTPSTPTSYSGIAGCCGR